MRVETESVEQDTELSVNTSKVNVTGSEEINECFLHNAQKENSKQIEKDSEQKLDACQFDKYQMILFEIRSKNQYYV